MSALLGLDPDSTCPPRPPAPPFLSRTFRRAEAQAVETVRKTKNSSAQLLCRTTLPMLSAVKGALQRTLR